MTDLERILDHLGAVVCVLSSMQEVRGRLPYSIIEHCDEIHGTVDQYV